MNPFCITYHYVQTEGMVSVQAERMLKKLVDPKTAVEPVLTKNGKLQLMGIEGL